MQYNVAYLTDIGRKRQKNQDNGGSFPDLGLFVVADGMGGHKGGETASKMVIDILPDLIKKAQKKVKWNPQKVIGSALIQANERIYKKSQAEIDLRGMGTTATALLIKDDIAVIGQVGDSRCYYIRPHSIWQLTRDHSLVQEKYRAGLITREEIKTDRLKNVITRSVGFDPAVDVDTFEMEISANDLFLICSDGLCGFIGDDETLEIIQKYFYNGKSIKETADALIQAANDKGGEDNITALLVQVID